MIRLAHLAIAVRDLAGAVRVYTEALGLSLAGEETLPEEGVRIAFLEAGGVRVELLESLGPDTPVGRFLERRGEGIHHVAFYVEDLDAALARARERGLQPAGGPRRGAEGRRIAFLHPSGSHGVLVELIQAS
ncbi:MAG: methylmalonyl-CoA epimerase [Armatimonadota bacterium]|nr:methylmalonyl-CoA epimerase [Armatimonadota bacterium]MDR7448399.1 methylmalonyl-CoA epimerase [Armatimonadota bacterium]MDR7460126.1 methylmalonyl-CoA epimerase [Armatimonadota bacterium]MDR7480323.1 methylmalonyl-CoA epimerase [Armatimonadota bacterium]MDR7489392.1 methylmalonyl-CoA epimerase [Armatimonadota bacterium]